MTRHRLRAVLLLFLLLNLTACVTWQDIATPSQAQFIEIEQPDRVRVTMQDRTQMELERPVVDGDELVVGSLRLRCFHTPGHCVDHLVLYEPQYYLLVTGDLLFVGKVGGTTTDTDARTEWTSLQRVFDTLPNETTVWPGHDYGARPSSTIGLERHTNPFLRCVDVDGFLQLRGDWADYKRQMGLK